MEKIINIDQVTIQEISRDIDVNQVLAQTQSNWTQEELDDVLEFMRMVDSMDFK